MHTIEAFLDALALEPTGPDRYRAANMESEHHVVFGGQLLAQSVIAALAGQEARPSRPSTPSSPVVAPSSRPSRSRSTGCTAGAPWPAAR